MRFAGKCVNGSLLADLQKVRRKSGIRHLVGRGIEAGVSCRKA